MAEYDYQDFFDRLGDSVFICNVNYGETLGTFRIANKTAVNLTGYSLRELCELDLLKITTANFEKELTAILDDLLKKGQVYFDFQVLRKDGSIVNTEVNATLFDLNNQPSVLMIFRTSAARDIAEERLKQAFEQLRNLALHLQTIREEERKTAAREIHDELGQVLTVLKIQISLLSKKLRDDQKELKNKIEDVCLIIDDTVEAVHRISSKLRPDILDELGLAAALEWQANEFYNNTGILCECTLIRNDLNIEREACTAVFRIFQEALTNVARHANASKVKVILRESPDNIFLEIHDNGKGITRSQINNPKSLGILGMKERALLFGGSVEVKSSMENGTLVLVRIPVLQQTGAVK